MKRGARGVACNRFGLKARQISFDEEGGRQGTTTNKTATEVYTSIHYSIKSMRRSGNMGAEWFVWVGIEFQEEKKQQNVAFSAKGP